jgi:hypothetical protein
VYRILISISVLFIPFCLNAQTAQDYFHRGAQFYIWNQKQKATNEIFSGLKLFPTDPQLNGLAGLIKKDEENQKQQQQNQSGDQSKQDQQQKQNQDQSKQAQQNQSEQKKDSGQQNQENQQSKQDQQQQQAARQSQEQQKKQASEANDQQNQKEGETNQQEYASGQMTPEQARQLLDAQKGDEKMLPVKHEGKPAERAKHLKDW